MTDFPKTAKALLAEENVLWDVIDALAEEMPGDCSASSVNDCRKYLVDRGVEKAPATLVHYRLTGSYLDAATPSQRAAFRAQSATTIINFAVYSVDPAEAVRNIREYQKRTGRTRMGSMAVRELHSKANVSRHVGDPENWSAADWQRFDAEVVKASRLLIRAGHLQDKGYYAPSVAAAAMLAILNPGDLDDEFRQMLEQERR